jgi:hypothetical protein
MQPLPIPLMWPHHSSMSCGPTPSLPVWTHAVIRQLNQKQNQKNHRVVGSGTLVVNEHEREFSTPFRTPHKKSGVEICF